MEFLLFLLMTVTFVGLIHVVLGVDTVIVPTLQAAVRFLWRRHPHLADKLGLGRESSDPHDFNNPAAGMVGRFAVVEQAIVGGRGRVTMGGTTWSAQGPDLPAGTRVKITGARETVLVVEPD